MGLFCLRVCIFSHPSFLFKLGIYIYFFFFCREKAILHERKYTRADTYKIKVGYRGGYQRYYNNIKVYYIPVPRAGTKEYIACSIFPNPNREVGTQMPVPGCDISMLIPVDPASTVLPTPGVGKTRVNLFEKNLDFSYLDS